MSRVKHGVDDGSDCSGSLTYYVTYNNLTSSLGSPPGAPRERLVLRQPLYQLKLITVQ